MPYIIDMACYACMPMHSLVKLRLVQPQSKSILFFATVNLNHIPGEAELHTHGIQFQ